MDYELMVAVYAADLETARVALALGADPNAGVDGHTALLEAVHQGNREMTVLLLEAGADPNLKQPLEFAGDVEIARLLLDAGALVFSGGSSSALHSAAAGGDLEMLRLLVARSNDPAGLDRFDETGATPLGNAVAMGKTEAVRFLLELGSDPDRCDRDKIAYTPLSKAAHNPEIVKLLLDAGADPDHSWGLCSTGRQALMKEGGAVRELLEDFERRPATGACRNRNRTEG